MEKDEFLKMLDTNDAGGVIIKFLNEMNPHRSPEIIAEVTKQIMSSPVNSNIAYKTALDYYILATQLSFLKDKNGQVIKYW